MAESLLRLDEVKARVALGRSKILMLIEAGQFPRPIKVSGRVNAWLASEIEAWIQQRVRESRPNEGEE